jgi:hypothetical protein
MNISEQLPLAQLRIRASSGPATSSTAARASWARAARHGSGPAERTRSLRSSCGLGVGCRAHSLTTWRSLADAPPLARAEAMTR